MRLKLTAIGVCVLALSSMSLFASAASATSWVVLTSGGKALENLKALVGGQAENKKISLLSKYLGISSDLRCSALELIGANLELEGKITSGFKARFTGCLFYLNGELAEECTPHSPGKPAGTIETNALKGSLVLSEVLGPIKVEPKEGISFVTLEMPVSCPVSSKISISGVLYLQDGQYLLPQHQISHLLEEASGTAILFNGEKASVDGSMTAFLVAEHVGLKWGAPEDLPHKPSWLVLEAAGGEPLKKLNAALQVKNSESTVSLLTKMLGMKVQIRCSGSELSGGSLGLEGKISNFKSKFTGCELLNAESGKTIEECIPRTKGMSPGVVESAELKAEISGESLVKVTSVSGALASLEWGSNCLLAQVPVWGSLYLKDAEGKFGEHLVSHAATQGSGTKLWVGQESAEHLETSIDGGASAFLSGAHSGLKWSGMS